MTDGTVRPTVAELPRWVTLAALLPSLAAAVLGVSGLALALAGVYSLWLTILISIPVIGFVSWNAAIRIGQSEAAIPDAESAAGLGRGQWYGAALVALALLFGALYLSSSSEHVLIDRDPGVYNSVARWISGSGDIAVEDPGSAFSINAGAPSPEAELESLGVYAEEGRLTFQFAHLFSAVLASGEGVGGSPLMFQLPGILMAAGLISFGWLCWSVLGGRMWALVGPAMLGVSLPALYVARDSYSESLAFPLLMSAAVALLLAERRGEQWLFCLGGILFGSTVITRIDGLAYLPALIVLAAFLIVANRITWKNIAAVAGGAAVPIAVGAWDWFGASGRYLDNVGPQLGLLFTAIGISFVLAFIVRRNGEWLSARFREFAPKFALPVGVLLAIVLILLALRPLFLKPEGSANGWVGVLQERAGLAVNSGRLYSEQTVSWLAAYYGPIAVMFAGIGATIAVIAFLRGNPETEHREPAAGTPAQGDSAALNFLLILLGPITAIYLLSPSAVPDHPWVMRRFLVAAIPLLVVLAIFAAQWLASRFESVPVRTGIVAIASVAFLVPPAIVAAPMLQHSQQDGFLEVVQDACGLAGDDAVFLVVGWPERDILPATLRSWCGQPAASVEPEDVQAVAASVASDYTPVIVTFEAETAAEYSGLGSDQIKATSEAEDRYRPAPTLGGPPEGFVVEGNELTTPLRLQLHLARLGEG